MFRTYCLMLLFFPIIAIANGLPNDLFQIQLMSNISSLKGEVKKGKRIFRIRGVDYLYYSVDDNHYSANDRFDNLIVQARINDGRIAAIIGATTMSKDKCLLTIDKYRQEVEREYSIKFSERNNNPYYLVYEDNKMLMLGCEIKKESVFKLILAQV